MFQFLNAALPWIILGLFIAFVTTRLNKNKEDGEKQEQGDKANRDHRLTGMCIGMMFGVALSISCKFPLWIGEVSGIGIGYLMGKVYVKNDK